MILEAWVTDCAKETVVIVYKMANGNNSEMDKLISVQFVSKCGFKYLKFNLSLDELPDLSQVNLNWRVLHDNFYNCLQSRAELHRMKEEKLQQYKRDQFKKLKHQEDEYLHRKADVEKENVECKVKLKEMEYSSAETKKKITTEKEINSELQNRIVEVKLEKEKTEQTFKKTWKSYLTVMSWYKKYLSIHVKLDEDNKNMITISFCKNLQKDDIDAPRVRFEILGGNKWRLLSCHPTLEGWENDLNLEDGCQVTAFLYKARKAYIQSNHLNSN